MRLRALLLATLALLPLAAAAPVAAQSLTDTRAMVVSSCGAQSFPLTIGGAQAYAPLTMLQNGTLCTVVGSGGGGGSTLSLPQTVTTTPTNPSVSATSAKQILAANGSRRYLQFRNETAGDCHYTFGPTQPAANVGMLLRTLEPSTTESSSIDPRALNIWCAQAGIIDILEGQ